MSDTNTNRALILAVVAGFILALFSTATAQTANPLESDTPTENAPESPLTASPGNDDGAEPEATEVASTPSNDAGAVDSGASDESSEAEPENPAKDDPVGTGTDIVQAIKDGKWLAAFGGVLLFLVFGIRWALIFFKVKWAETKPGGFIIAFGTSLALAMGIAFQAGIGFSFGLLAGAASAAWLAAGQHGHIKDVVEWVRGRG